MIKIIAAVFLAFSYVPLVANAQSLPGGPSELKGSLHRGPDGSLIVEPTPSEETTHPQRLETEIKSKSERSVSATNHQQAPKNPLTSVSQLSENRKPFICAPHALTCVEIVSTSEKVQLNVPITFGQPFHQADVSNAGHIIAHNAKGDALPTQLDARASFADGSLRFAVISTALPELAPHETQLVSLFKEADADSASPRPTVIPADFSLEVQANLYSPQVSVLVFGNRMEQASGIPFLEGEKITLILGDGSEDIYTVAVTGNMVGGAWPSLTKIAEAFMAQINSRSKTFSAYKVGEGGGYERLWITSRAPSGKPFKVAFSYDGKAQLKVDTLRAPGTPKHLVAKLRPILDKVVSDGRNAWLKGAVVKEFSIPVPFVDEAGQTHPQLSARFNVRLFPDGKRVRTDVVVENDWAYEPNPGNLIYDVAIVEQGNTVFKNPAFTHFHHARWHKLIWWGDEAKLRVRHNIPYFLASRAVWNYDIDLPLSEAALANTASSLARSNTGLMGNAMITQYMPTTGGRSDIGPLPEWAAMYLISQDPRLEAVLYANADAGAAIPIHYRDRPTDQPVSILDHPGLAMGFGKPRGRDAFPTMADADTPWTTDSAHQPSLSYLPYLLTGDVFYLDEVLFWADWNLGVIDPTYRDGGLISWNQIRGQAWALRALGEAAQITPDHHPAHAYFRAILDRNLDWYDKTYVQNPDRQVAPILGFLAKPEELGSSPPWQNDFMYLVLGRLVDSGEVGGTAFLHWMSRFTVGLWTHEAAGYCHTQAPAYYLKVKDEAGRNIENWGALFRTNFPDMRSCPKEYFKESYPDSPFGYAANARAALAVGADFQIDGAAEAFARLRMETPAMEAGFANDPTWDIVPRKAER